MDVHDLELNSLLVISFLNKLKLTCLHSIITSVSTQINGFKYFYLSLIILFNINHLFGNSEGVSIIVLTNSFICTHLNGFNYFYLSLIILFNIICSFVQS